MSAYPATVPRASEGALHVKSVSASAGLCSATVRFPMREGPDLSMVNVTEAEAAFIRLVEMEPDNLDYLLALADHYVKRGELRKALPIAERMISTHPEAKIGHDVKAHIEGELDGR